MTTKSHHILNGDFLKKQFPKTLTGNIIVARECMIDGTIHGENFEQIMASRSKFICESYKITPQDYQERTLLEFQKIKQLKEKDEVYLWFEHDLFCQTNMWFILYLINQYTSLSSVQLITPTMKHRYRFGALSNQELIEAFENRKEITALEIKIFSDLWVCYQNDETDKLFTTGKKLNDRYPFVPEAISAHVHRKPDSNGLGRPERTLIRLSKELRTMDFKTIFQQFSKEEEIYGFGDSQVKRMFDKLIEEGKIK